MCDIDNLKRGLQQVNARLRICGFCNCDEMRTLSHTEGGNKIDATSSVYLENYLFY